MAIIKKQAKPKPQAFADRAEFEAAVDRMAKLNIQIQKQEAALKARHQALDDKYMPEIKAGREELADLFERAEPFFHANAKTLCKPGTKQGETKLAFYGVKIGMPTVIKHIRDSWKSVAARWFADEELKAYARSTPEVDKEEILRVFRDAERVEEQKLLRTAGFSVEQDPKEFWVKPKAEEQVKA